MDCICSLCVIYLLLVVLCFRLELRFCVILGWVLTLVALFGLGLCFVMTLYVWLFACCIVCFCGFCYFIVGFVFYWFAF